MQAPLSPAGKSKKLPLQAADEAGNERQRRGWPKANLEKQYPFAGCEAGAASGGFLSIF
jgi:hypothetical protein